MGDFFDQVYFDNTVRMYCISLGIILFVLLINRLISKYAARLLFSMVKKDAKKVDRQSFIDLVVHPLGLFVVVSVSIIVLHKLHFPTAWNVEVYRYSLMEVIHMIGTTIFIISFIWLLTRVIDFIAGIMVVKADLVADQSDHQLIIFFKDFFKVILAITGILLIMHFAFDFHIGNLVTGLSIVGAAIALSLRESLENLIASFVIFFDKPFSMGDTVRVQGITGSVEKIGLRSTRIRTDQKTYVTVPNKQMVDSILDNLSLRTHRKGEIILELDLGTPVKKIEELVHGLRIILSIKNIETSSVLLESISGNAFIVHADYLTAPTTQEEFNQVREGVNFALLKYLEERGIKMAGANKITRIISQEQH